MGSALEPIVLSDSEDEGPRKKRAPIHSSYVNQPTNADDPYQWPPRQQHKPSQKPFSFSKSQTLGFTPFPRGVRTPGRITPTTNSPRTQMTGSPSKVSSDHPSSAISTTQRRTALSIGEVTMNSLNRISNGLSATPSKNGTPSTRLFTPDFAQLGRISAPQAQPRLRKDMVSTENKVPDQEMGKVSSNSGAKTCQNCIRVNITCDGLQPCTSCKQRQDDCVYQVNSLNREERPSLIVKLHMPRRSSASSSVDNPESPRHGSESEMVSDANQRPNMYMKPSQSNMDRPDVDSRLHLHSPHHERNLSYDRITADHELDNDSSDESTPPVEIDPSIDAVRTLVDALQKDQHSWQEKSVQADLRQATFDMKTRRLPNLDSSMPDPFQVAFEKRKVENEEDSLAASEMDGLGKASARPSQRKILLTRAVEKRFQTGGTILPKYKAIGRIASTFLAPNCHTQKYRPYDAEDEIQDPDATEKYLELEQRFNNNYDGLKAQRDCQELIWLWKPWAEQLFDSLQIESDHVRYYFVRDHFEPDRQLRLPWSIESARAWSLEWTKGCTTCELANHEERITSFSRNKFDELERPSDRNLALAGLAAYAFHQVTRISLWHIVAGGLIQPPHDEWEDDENGSEPCMICFRHHCPSHGNFVEDRDEDHAEDPKAYVNDEEKKQNVRQFMSLPASDVNDHKPHLCGVFCVDPSQDLQQILGRQPDGTISGDSRATAQTRSSFQDNEFCSISCFWEVSHRRKTKISEVKFQPFLSQSHRVLVEKLMRFYLNYTRGPCMISRIVKDVTCERVFSHMIYCMIQKPHPALDGDATSDSNHGQRHPNAVKKKRKPVTVMDVSRSGDLDQRPPFLPCSHHGPCHNDPKCNCYRYKVHCERFCGCDESCKRRFKGCSCVARGNKVCFKDNRCECWKLNRECDPSLCGKCGVFEVLDSYNKYNDDIRKGRCRNNRIQLGLPAPTTKAPSQIQGYGLYSRTDIPKEEFIGEYTGEVISKSEGNRRGAMYHVLGQEYLFIINKAQEIDASNNGNKMRFMNNSQREEHINVEPKMLWCSGVVRVGLFAKRHIKAGEELLYNYNYPQSKVQYFWEPGERPANTRAVVPLSHERIARTITATNAVGNIVNTMGGDGSLSPVPSRNRKRKRMVDESPELDNLETVTTADGVQSESEASRILEIEDSEDSEYRTNGRATEDEEIEELSDEIVSFGGTSKPSKVGANPPKGRSSKVVGATSRRVKKRSRMNGTATARRAFRPKDQMDGALSTLGAIRAKTKPMSRATHTKNKAGKLVIRKRKIGPNDRRFGGKAQQLAWETRRMNEALASARGK